MVPCTLSCGPLLWAGISWANASAMIVPGAWRVQHGENELNGELRLAFEGEGFSHVDPDGSLTLSSL